jgi:hypothetical protein
MSQKLPVFIALLAMLKKTGKQGINSDILVIPVVSHLVFEYQKISSDIEIY